MAVTDARPIAATPATPPERARKAGSPALRRLRRNRAAIVGLVVFSLIVLMALVWIAASHQHSCAVRAMSAGSTNRADEAHPRNANT